MLFNSSDRGRSVDGIMGMGLSLEDLVSTGVILLVGGGHTKVKGDSSISMY